MADVRGERVHRPAVAVERDRRVAALGVVTQKRSWNRARRPGRPRAQRLGARLAQSLQQAGGADGSLERIAPAPRTARSGRRRACRRATGWSLPSPSSPDWPVHARVQSMYDRNPSAPAERRIQSSAARRWGAAPAPLLGHAVARGVDEQAHPERRGIHRSVMRGGSTIPSPGIVSSAARSSCAIFPGSSSVAGSSRSALQAREDSESGCREPGVHRQHHACRPQRVASEQSEEPGSAGGEEDVLRCAGEGQPERFEIIERRRHPPRRTGIDAVRVRRPARRCLDAVDHEARVGHGRRPRRRHGGVLRDLQRPVEEQVVAVPRPAGTRGGDREGARLCGQHDAVADVLRRPRLRGSGSPSPRRASGSRASAARAASSPWNRRRRMRR